jgi:hypothetical protein
LTYEEKFKFDEENLFATHEHKRLKELKISVDYLREILLPEMKNICWKFIKDTIPHAGEEQLFRHARASDLYRFLIARDFNIEKAYDMFQKALVR